MHGLSRLAVRRLPASGPAAPMDSERPCRASRHSPANGPSSRSAPGPRGGQAALAGRLLLPLALLLPLQGCLDQRLSLRQTLHVVVVPTEHLEWMGKDYLRDGKAVEPLLQDLKVVRLRQEAPCEALRV